jgi:hypothetical protein
MTLLYLVLGLMFLVSGLRAEHGLYKVASLGLGIAFWGLVAWLARAAVASRS